MTASEPKSERLKKELRAARPALQREPRFPHETSRTQEIAALPPRLSEESPD